MILTQVMFCSLEFDIALVFVVSFCSVILVASSHISDRHYISFHVKASLWCPILAWFTYYQWQ